MKIGKKRKQIQKQVQEISAAAPGVTGEALLNLLRVARPPEMSVWEKTLWRQESLRAIGVVSRGYPIYSCAPMVNGRIVKDADIFDPESTEGGGQGGGVMSSMREWLRRRTDRAGLLLGR